MFNSSSLAIELAVFPPHDLYSTHLWFLQILAEKQRLLSIAREGHQRALKRMRDGTAGIKTPNGDEEMGQPGSKKRRV
jgi:hypothetical protein